MAYRGLKVKPIISTLEGNVVRSFVMDDGVPEAFGADLVAGLVIPEKCVGKDD